MRKRLKFFLLILVASLIILLLKSYITSHNIALFNPKGVIAQKQSMLIETELGIMLAALVPTVLLFYFFAWRYRSEEKKIPYTEGKQSVFTEAVLWIIPIVILLILSVLNWTSAHTLDPFRPIEAEGVMPITIDVVALDWKWLFIYPEQNIATVNEVIVPQNTPLEFDLTADAPMNSFWIPQLGGQLYAMGGMVTRLHLMASQTGQYLGKATEINGEGFSSMTFTVKSVPREKFDAWVNKVRTSYFPLTSSVYSELSKPSENYPISYYSSVENNLYNGIVAKFMMPAM